ncbi:ABC transporter substrate-binding protein [Taklimakanibacter deserti]|uniref:ABC transporter substrate-binding protein n=1 Tax=Taklimakanibacter deserti TaxID=2267839 RepID=UPI000E64AE0D
MSDKEHIWIPKLKQQLADKKIDRREFVRYASLLGMSSGAAYMWAGKITGEPLAPPAMAQDMPKGGTLKIAQRIPKVQNPHTFSWVYDSNVVRQVCGYLTRTGVDNVTRPHLVEKWEASEDLKTWTLHIKADAKWHKGGDFTAEQAAWNIKHCLDPKVGSSVVGLMKGYMLKEVDTGTKDDKGNPVMTTELWDANAIEIKDPKTLVLNLQQPQVAVPEHLFHYPFLMLDPAENGDFQVGSNGTESFELVELEVGRKAVFKRRPDAPGYLDELQFIDLGDNPAAVAAALASKQVDGIYQGNIEQFDLYKGLPHVDIHQVVTAQTAVARMQMTQKPFDDPKVRKAVRLATDPAKCLQIAHKGVGEPAEHHHVCTVHPDYKKIEPLGYKPDEAKKLLAEAGYPDGIDIEINCKPDPSWEQAAVEAMAEQWKAGNIRAKINVLPSAKFWELWTEVPFGFTEWTHRPLGFMVLALAYRTGVPWNESRYSNKQFDELLGKAEGTLDVDKRREILGELEAIMLEDGPITQPLWRSVYAAYDKRVQGFQIHPTLYIFGETLAIAPA